MRSSLKGLLSRKNQQNLHLAKEVRHGFYPRVGEDRNKSVSLHAMIS